VLLVAGWVLASGPLAELLTRVDLQPAHDDDAGAVIEATVAGYDRLYHITLLAFPGGQFTLARELAPLGRKVRLRVLARDVSLTLERQTGTSILNIFPCVIESVTDENPAQVMIRLNVNGVALLARVTRKSVAALGLSPGGQVYAQVKSVALLG
jgi:molybdate transport system ATP-binding protein